MIRNYLSISNTYSKTFLIFSKDATAYNLARYGQGSGAIHLDDVACRGSEDRLIDCTHVSYHNCLHLEDAGVRCSNKSKHKPPAVHDR